ncbi:hypothetical protein [Paenalcaligenes suwonensis]|uniref:hypothetical protein n=1 Tax=Paenalcaligenes suwonensis TaxID=1202713 RepID=UPI00140E0AC7|nr:hypothetical protein [Paenalcaligenes suwonensis]NHC62337.1 hypothetical protein [Paenalcaligenes suwonensis]
MTTITQRIFGVLATLTLLASLVMGLLFAIALLVGGELAATLALRAQQLSGLSMYLATLAVAVGILYLYLARKHELTFSMPSKNTTP